MKAKLLIFSTLILCLSSCTNSGRTLPAVTGTQFEVLIVVNDTVWNSKVGHELNYIFGQEMPGLPQAEPLMDVHQCSPIEFTDVLKSARNVVMVEVSDKYTTTKIKYGKDAWAYPQAIIKITAPDDTTLLASLANYGKNLSDYFVKAERERQIEFNKSYVNDQAKNEINKLFGIQIDIPKGISKSTSNKKDFYWITNDQAGTRLDIVIYSYPYTNKSMFTKDALLAMRDSVMKANIPGELKGSFMGTERKYAEPEFNEIWINDAYCAELRGLWKMKNGASMGGPFYSHSRLDEENQRIITVDAFVFAPGKNKRNAMRQLEAVVFTTKMPHEINALKEVSVVAKTDSTKK